MKACAPATGLNAARPIQLLGATSEVAIEGFIARHKPWIEDTTGCLLAEAVIFDFFLPFSHLVLDGMFAGIPTDKRSIDYATQLRPVVSRWQLPPGFAPQIELGMARMRQQGMPAGSFGWTPEWTGTPLAIWLSGCTHGLVSARVTYKTATMESGPSSCNLLIVNRCDMVATLGVLEKIMPPKTISMVDGRRVPIPPDGSMWNPVVLTPSLDRLVRQDFESFFQREEWFRRHNMPYRRGYLLYGPPGNGKTTAARIMAAHPAVRAFAADFRTTEFSAPQMSEMFEAAAAQGPAVVVLEDIDKIGGGDPEALQHVLNCLLSCMDGIEMAQGVVVVASANDLSALNAPLLRRPGRFDRLALFPAPGVALREVYLGRLSGGRLSGRVEQVAAQMERFSFAQVREAYILAGQFAFERDDDVNASDLADAVRQMKRERRRLSEREGGGVGFSAATREEESLSVGLPHVAGAEGVSGLG